MAAYLVWMFSKPKDAEHNREAEAVFRRYGFKVCLNSSPTVARRTMFLTMSIAAVTFGTLLFTYFFLGVNGGEVWPPPGATFPDLPLALVAVSGLLVAWGLRGVRYLRRGPVLRLNAAAFVLALAGGALQVLRGPAL